MLAVWDDGKQEIVHTGEENYKEEVPLIKDWLKAMKRSDLFISEVGGNPHKLF
jgi:hypothetical protein